MPTAICSRKEPFRLFPLVILGVLLLNFFIQTTGGIQSFLWPAYFVLASIVAVFLPMGQTLAAGGVILAIEACNLLFYGAAGTPNACRSTPGFAASLLIVPAVISRILHLHAQGGRTGEGQA